VDKQSASRRVSSHDPLGLNVDKSKGSISAGRLPSSTTYVTYVTNDRGRYSHYVSTFGVGLDFGDYLPHPTTSDPTGIHDGEPIDIASIQPNWPAYGYESSFSGEYFTLIRNNTYTTSDNISIISDWVSTVTSDFSLFVDGSTSWTTSDQTDLNADVTEYPAAVQDDGHCVGRLVRDHNSPTFMSVTGDLTPYVAPSNQYNLGAATISGYYFVFYVAVLNQSSGSVSGIDCWSSQSRITKYVVNSYTSINYTTNPDQSLTLQPANGGLASIVITIGNTQHTITFSSINIWGN